MEMLTMTDTENNWIKIQAVEEHEECRALHVDKKSGALVCYGYGHGNNYIRGRRYRILEVNVDEIDDINDWTGWI